MVDLDPLKNVAKAEYELFQRIAQVSAGHSTEQVVAATVNLLCNALRQGHPTRDPAMARIDQLMAEMKTMLARHYDLTGKRINGSFPFHQTIEIPHMDFRGTHKFNGR